MNMKLKIAAAMIAAFFAGPACAAPAVTKAVPFVSPYPVSGNGFYYGINVLASASPIQDASTAGAAAIGGDVGGLVGWTYTNGNANFVFAEAMFDFQNLNGGAAGLSLSGPAHLEQRIGVGSPLNTLMGSLITNPNLPAVPGIPTLPNGITAGPQNGYVYAALNEDDVSASLGAATARDWNFSPEVGLGMMSRLSNGVMADVWAGAKLEGQAICVGSAAARECPKIGTGFVTGLSFKY